jgi:hypothetical protein
MLPYWTDRHASLALDVGRAGRRLGLGRLTPADVVVDGDRLRATLPLYVPDATGVLLRLTAPGGSHEVLAGLSPGGHLEAALPLADLAGRRWRAELCLAPETPEPRFHPLPVALRAGADGVRPVRAPRPGRVRRLAGRVRRALRRIVRGVASRVTARRE